MCLKKGPSNGNKTLEYDFLPRNFGVHYSWARTIFSKAAINMAGNVGNVDIPYIQEPVEEMVHGWIFGFGIILEYPVWIYYINYIPKFQYIQEPYMPISRFWMVLVCFICTSLGAPEMFVMGSSAHIWSQPMV